MSRRHSSTAECITCLGENKELKYIKIPLGIPLGSNEVTSIMEHFKSILRRDSTDLGFISQDLEPLNSVGRVGRSGIDKTFTLHRMIELAYEIKANIIIKAGPNAKWYLKRCPIDKLEDEIAKQAWRNTKRSTMWVIEWRDN